MILDPSNKLDLDVTNHFRLIKCFCNYRRQRLYEFTLAVADTEFLDLYKTVIHSKCHYAIGKETVQTNHIERLNNPLRQRISRLVRQSLSFSKKMDNHIGAIWYFIHNYKAQLAKH